MGIGGKAPPFEFLHHPQPAGREGPQRIVIVLQGDADLLEVVAALRPPGRLAGHLHGGQQQRDQHADDGDDDEELDEGESARVMSVSSD